MSRSGFSEALQHFVDAIPVAVSVIDMNGHIQAVNYYAERLLGFPRDELLGGSALTLISVSHQRDFNRWLQGAFDVCQEAADVPFRELVCRHKIFGERHVHVALSTLPGDFGTFVLATLVDTASPSSAGFDANKRRSLPSVTEQIPALVWRVDRQLRFVSLIGAGLDRFEITPAQAVGVTLYGFFRTDDSNCEPIVAHREALNGACTYYELRWGGRTYQNYVEPIYAPDHKVVGATGIALDITHLRGAESELRKSESRFRSMVENSNDWVWELDDNLRYVYVNSRVCDLLGYTVDEVVGRSFHDLVSPPQLPLLEKTMQSLVAERRPFRTLEYICVAKDGTRVLLEASGWPIYNLDGYFCGYQGSCRDLAERSSAEQIITNVMRVISGEIGDAFFETLTMQLCDALAADYVMVAELVDDPGKSTLSTLGFCVRGGLQDNLTFDVKGTPWESVIGGEYGSCLSNLNERFPDATLLQRFPAEAFVGLPLFALDGTVLGVISVLFVHPLSDCEVSHWALQVFAERTAAELQRKRTQESLDLVNTQWTQAMDAFEDPVYLLDLNDNVIRANQAFYDMVGLCDVDVIGHDVTTIMHPDGEESPCPVCLARIERRDAHIILEAENPVNKAGRPREVTVRMIRDDHGEPYAVLMGMHDLTRTRRNEEELRRLNAHVRMLLESTGEGIFGVDAASCCTFVNKAAATMLGYSPEELQGQDMHAMVHYQREDGTDYPRDECLIFRTVQEGRDFLSDKEVLWQKCGAPIPVQYSSHPIFDAERVVGAVVVFRNVAEARAMARRMDYLATHDTLTGLYNRHEFETRLSLALDNHKKKGWRSVLCYLDLDQFKVVNDTCGHVAGDKLLYQLSAILQTKIRSGDIIARLGGDEFGVLLQNTTLDGALKSLNKLREAVRDFRFRWDDKTFALGVSIGVVPITSRIGTLVNAMSAADAACYVAKDAGRNRIHVYQADDAELTRRHGEMQWVSRIQAALEGDRFSLYFQRIEESAGAADVASHYEVLLRMRDTQGKLVQPGAFLSAAERYNLMPAIDRWVISRTFAWLHSNKNILDQTAFCSVNVSANSLGDETLLRFIVQQLRDYCIPPDKLCFEITETAAVSNMGRALGLMTELKRLGCRFALDDFGCGMSSFAYLKDFPVDFLKIDGNFVKDILDDPVDFAMVEAINKVGQVMGIQTIAEFVESKAIMEKLRDIGVDYVQGYGISRPMPIDDYAVKHAING